MGENSKIAWTENTWSPWWGCRETSPACRGCYAKRLAHRFGHDCWGEKPRRVLSESHWKQPLKWQRKAEREGRIIPVFPSMCDVFEYKDRPELTEPRGRLIRLIRHTPNLFWLLLTKRPEHAADMLEEAGYDPYRGDSRNLSLGVTVENNDYRWRIDEVLKIPAALYFLSVEPMLGEVDLRFVRVNEDYCGSALHGFPIPGGEQRRLGWVIVGTESGPKRRPTNIAHIRSLRDQCVAAGIPFLLKQMEVGGKLVKLPMLDGRTWDEVPEVMR